MNFWTWLCLNGLDGCHFNPFFNFCYNFLHTENYDKKTKKFQYRENYDKKSRIFQSRENFYQYKKASALIACLKVFKITSL
ncbi:hypothetical protein CP362_02595 [Lactobacillus sp. UMNPBX11]|nr:hypothetical protein AYP81_04215 [Lactobacillus crispatus]PEG91382.1 hypothetical protein CP363_02400 [Lactobacillus sp. UMNPBX12]PEG93300.1 hypothetical protein CP362_02595 [Lactobacillus sp. UMNPBX11]OXC23124.1 hypothetical protein AYP84_03455 [Lactobacillus crispatus]OXC33442.1 hypothetical protein AYP89_09605 [Lactobacillus crispatus]